jgi:hypothetical protein
MKVGRFATRLEYSLIGVLTLMSVSGSHARAQGTSHHDGTAPDQKSALVNVVRESTGRFRDVSAAEAEGYARCSAASADLTPGRWGSTL